MQVWVRRIVAELQATNMGVGASQVRKVLKEKELWIIQPRSFVPKITYSRHSYPISPNLLLERSAPVKPDEVWLGDITYIPMTDGGFLHLSVWLDLYSRRIVGWHLVEHMKEDLIIAAF